MRYRRIGDRSVNDRELFLRGWERTAHVAWGHPREIRVFRWEGDAAHVKKSLQEGKTGRRRWAGNSALLLLPAPAPNSGTLPATQGRPS